MTPLSFSESAVIAMIATIIGVCAWQSVKRANTEPVCAEERVVAEIVKVAYRSSTYRDTTGQLHTIIQGTYQPGDVMCLEWKR